MSRADVLTEEPGTEVHLSRLSVGRESQQDFFTLSVLATAQNIHT